MHFQPMHFQPCDISMQPWLHKIFLKSCVLYKDAETVRVAAKRKSAAEVETLTRITTGQLILSSRRNALRGAGLNLERTAFQGKGLIRDVPQETCVRFGDHHAEIGTELAQPS